MSETLFSFKYEQKLLADAQTACLSLLLLITLVSLWYVISEVTYITA